ncbi:hypothetical protein OXPF_12280 [Oxobacter pfennigii]|uniref:Uncharacterized protein n=1 Tax=Oxobacter pfennigii TaxID=36849 RepID=A0A0P9AIP4_9CLOT|nr:hypothetical protein [Oxobacter pfennigii]KPU45335.1 hypothetical protein OXPF_12280 [Oxobacter pfennigii]
MLLKVDNCKGCGLSFAFDSSECSQAILKDEGKIAKIIFFPRCPGCNKINTVQLPWEEYGIIDY